MNYDSAWWLSTAIATAYSDADPECVDLAISASECMEGMSCVKSNCPKSYATALAIATALNLPSVLSFKDGSLEGQKHTAYISNERVKDVSVSYSAPKVATASDGSPIFGNLRDILNDIIRKCETPVTPFFGVLGGVAPGSNQCGCTHDEDLFRAYSPWSKRRKPVTNNLGGWPPTSGSKAHCEDDPLCPGLKDDQVKCIIRLANKIYSAIYGQVDPATAVDGQHYFNADGATKLEKWDADGKCLVPVTVCTGNKVKFTDGNGVAQCATYDQDDDEWTLDTAPPSSLDHEAVLACILAAGPDFFKSFCDLMPTEAFGFASSTAKKGK